MTADEVKEALFKQEPVCLKDDYGFTSEYKAISAVIYRVKDNKVIVSVEVLDPLNKNSVCIVDPKHLFLKSAEKEQKK